MLFRSTYKSRNPQEAADAVNHLMDAYIENNIQTNREETTAAREFIAKQLPTVQATVREAEATLRNFKEKNHIVALEQEAAMAVDAITGIDRQLTTAQAQLADATARASQIQSKIDLTSQQAVTLSSLNQSTAVRQSLEELQIGRAHV